MLHKILLRIERLSFFDLCILVLGVNLAFAIAANSIDYKFASNMRIEFFLTQGKYTAGDSSHDSYDGFLVQWENCLERPDCSTRSLASPDDPGNALIFWLTNMITPASKNIFEYPRFFRDPANHPLAEKIFYVLLHYCMLILFIFISQKVANNLFILLAGVSFALFENLLFITYGWSIYLFPAYALLLSLAFLDVKKFSRSFITQISILIGVLTWFRSSSLSIFLTAALLSTSFHFFSKDKIALKNSLLSFVLALFVGLMPSLYFQRASHVFWHSMHAGLFEQGSVKDAEQFIPLHLYNQANHVASTQPTEVILGWADQIEYETVQKNHPEIQIYSPEYEKHLKAEYFRLWSLSWKKNLFFYLERIPVLLSCNPLKGHAVFKDLYLMSLQESSWSKYIWCFFFLLMLLLFLRNSHVKIWTKLLLTSLCLVAGLPCLLIHPNFISYNAAWLVGQWILIFWIITTLTQNFSKSSLGKGRNFRRKS